MRTSQRNLHHQLLRSGVLITRSSHAGMPVRDWHGRFQQRAELLPLHGTASGLRAAIATS
jgi:hypothetical protein